MTRDLGIALLRTFVAVADRRHMSRASAALNTTQSAVSQQIARLEGLTRPLFIRDRRGLHLRPSGCWGTRGTSWR